MLAEVHAGLGDYDKSFEYMNRAYEEHSPLLAWLRTIPEYDAVRSDPRYDELLRRLGLTQDALSAHAQKS